jgi:hypothetical protein
MSVKRSAWAHVKAHRVGMSIVPETTPRTFPTFAELTLRTKALCFNIIKKVVEMARSVGESPPVYQGDDLSEEAYAARVLKLIHDAEVYAAKSETDKALVCAYSAGLEEMEASQKFRWEKHALRGEKDAADKRKAQRESARARRNRNIADRIEWRRIAGRLDDNLPLVTKAKMVVKNLRVAGASPTPTVRQVEDHLRSTIPRRRKKLTR